MFVSLRRRCSAAAGFALLAAALAGCAPPFSLMAASPAYQPVAATELPSGVPKPYYFPDRPITLLVASPRGTDADIAARVLAPRLEKVVAQPVVVVNPTGAEGLRAWSQLRQAQADGYTLGLIASPGLQFMALDPQGKAPFTLADFAPVANELLEPGALFVRAWSPLKTFQEFVAAARNQPGGIPLSIPAGSPADRLAAEDLQRKAGIKIRVIEFVDATNARLAALSGQVEAELGRRSTLTPLVRSGQGRFLAFLDDKRLQEWPEVSIPKEAGIDLVSYGSLGYAAPRGTPKEVVDYLAGALQIAMSAPEAQNDLREAGLTLRFMGPAEYSSFLATQEEGVRRSLTSKSSS